MRRKNKHQGESLGYVYWAKPIEPLPQEWKDEHGDMVRLWNTLLSLNAWVRRINAPVSKKYFRHLCRLTSNEPRFRQLYWCNQDAVIDAFCNAREQALSGTARAPKRQGFYRTRKSFFMRQNNGWSPDGLCSNSSRFYLTQPDHRGRTTLYWNIRGTMIPFRVVLHRPLPEDARIQNVRLRQDGRRWRLAFNLRIPPRPKLPHGDDIATFEPVWIFSRDDVRIGTLSLNGKVWPLAWSGIDNHRDRPKTGVVSHLTRATIAQQKADAIIEDIKAKLASWLPALRELGWRGDPEKYRVAGIYRARDLIKEHYPDNSMHKWLDKRLRQWRRYIHESGGIQGRISRHRTWLHWNFGKWLAERCRLIVLQDIDFAALKRKEKKGYPRVVPAWVASNLRETMSYGAPSELYSIIEKQATKHGIEVIKTTSDDITQINRVLNTKNEFAQISGKHETYLIETTTI